MASVKITVTLKPSLLDSAGKTIESSLAKLGFENVSNVRIGKLITLEVEGGDKSQGAEMCDKLLANPVIEDYVVEVEE